MGLALLLQHSYLGTPSVPQGARAPLVLGAAALLGGLYARVASAVRAGSSRTEADDNSGLFRAPCVPLLPCCGILFNCFLLAQFELQAWLITLGYVLLCLASYASYGYHHSVGGRTRWKGTLEVEPFAVRVPVISGEERRRHRTSFSEAEPALDGAPPRHRATGVN